MDVLYDEIDKIEESMSELEQRMFNIKQQKVSADNVYQFLLFFDKLYTKFTDIEKKQFLKSFVSEVDIFEKRAGRRKIFKTYQVSFPGIFGWTGSART